MHNQETVSVIYLMRNNFLLPQLLLLSYIYRQLSENIDTLKVITISEVYESIAVFNQPTKILELSTRKEIRIMTSILVTILL